MKKIEAIIAHSKIDSVLQQLRNLGVANVTTEVVDVFDESAAHTMTYRGCQYVQKRVSRTRLGFLVSEDDASKAEALVGS